MSKDQAQFLPTSGEQSVGLFQQANHNFPKELGIPLSWYSKASQSPPLFTRFLSASPLLSCIACSVPKNTWLLPPLGWTNKPVYMVRTTSKVKVNVAQSCPTLCDPMDCSLPGSSVHGIFQARVLERVAISFSRRSAQPRDRTQVSCVVGRRFTVWATGEVRTTKGW